MKYFLKKINIWTVAIFALGAILITNYFFDINFSITPKGKSNPQNPQVKSQTKALDVNAPEIYKKLICDCCGKSIADCTCGMAKERRAFVDEQVARGLERISVFKEAIKEYGEEILLDKALAVEIKNEIISEAPKDRPILSVEPESIDLGEVSISKGKVETAFKVKNVGKSDLLISGIETSCSCTTAILKVAGRKSPTFGMHDNPTDWSETLNPGQEGELVAMFDPGHHGPEGVGPATRIISMKSSDPIDSFKKVQFEVNVIK